MKKNQKLKNTIELYKKIWKSIVITVLCLSIWWCINGFIDNKWTGVKEHFLLLDDAIVQSISFLVTLSVITLIWQGIFLYYFSRITTLNGVTHRPYILGYMTFLSFTE